MFEFGGSLQELLLIFVVALLVVGPKRLPEVGRMLARACESYAERATNFAPRLKPISTSTPLPQSQLPPNPRQASLRRQRPPT